MAAALVLLGPIMGLCLPWGRLTCPAGPSLRVLTCNVDGHNFDVARLMNLVADTNPDVVAIQEYAGDPLPWPPGWHVQYNGELLVASRYPLRDFEPFMQKHPPHHYWHTIALRCTMDTSQGPLVFCCVHLTSPHYGLDALLDHQTGINPTHNGTLMAEIEIRRVESATFAKWLGAARGPMILAGDFNMPTDSTIYREVWSGWTNAFSTSGFGFGYTKWTAIRGWPFGARIDHVLGGPGLAACRSWVGPAVGSDHLPLLAELSLLPAE
jgi:endonuclease/exonuclease/phosphatase (EEP) superfamily protein YafD